MGGKILDGVLRRARLERLQIFVQLSIRREAIIDFASSESAIDARRQGAVDGTGVRAGPRRRWKHDRIGGQKGLELFDQGRDVGDEERETAAGRFPDLDHPVTNRNARSVGWKWNASQCEISEKGLSVDKDGPTPAHLTGKADGYGEPSTPPLRRDLDGGALFPLRQRLLGREFLQQARIERARVGNVRTDSNRSSDSLACVPAEIEFSF